MGNPVPVACHCHSDTGVPWALQLRNALPAGRGWGFPCRWFVTVTVTPVFPGAGGQGILCWQLRTIMGAPVSHRRRAWGILCWWFVTVTVTLVSPGPCSCGILCQQLGTISGTLVSPGQGPADGHGDISVPRTRGWGLLCQWFITVTVTPVSPGAGAWRFLCGWFVTVAVTAVSLGLYSWGILCQQLGTIMVTPVSLGVRSGTLLLMVCHPHSDTGVPWGRGSGTPLLAVGDTEPQPRCHAAHRSASLLGTQRGTGGSAQEEPPRGRAGGRNTQTSPQTREFRPKPGVLPQVMVKNPGKCPQSWVWGVFTLLSPARGCHRPLRLLLATPGALAQCGCFVPSGSGVTVPPRGRWSGDSNWRGSVLTVPAPSPTSVTCWSRRRPQCGCLSLSPAAV